MADAVTSQTLIDRPAHAVLKFTNISDGTGESAVTKVDVSALESDQNGLACTGVNHDYTVFGGLTNNAGSGKTGDINFTTIGATANDTYTVVFYLRKKFG